MPTKSISQLTLPIGIGPGGPVSAPSPWTNNGSWVSFDGGVVVGLPIGGNLGVGSVNATAFFLNGQPFDFGNYLPLTGGIIGGPLTVDGPATFNGTIDGIVIDMGTF